MTETPRFSTFVKATDKVTGPPAPSLAWAFSKRTSFQIWDDHVTVGPWTLPHADVTHATLYQAGKMLPSRLLELQTPGQCIQVNFNPGIDPAPHLPYPVDIQPYPAYLKGIRIALRIIIVLGIGFLVLNTF